ncbi:MAG: hypothetical protein LC808_24060, partial [Actinobacteria bacterium]|nr:hypothetical protein [Actinomycetota bacterium]
PRAEDELRRILGLLGLFMLSCGSMFGVALFSVDADAGDQPSTSQVSGGSGEAPVVLARIPSPVRTTLLPEEEAQVRKSVAGSRVVLDAIGDAGYSVDKIALWSDDAGQVLGGVALLQLDRPVALRRGFPTFAPVPRNAQGEIEKRPSTSPFALEPAPFEAPSVRQVTAFVDLRHSPEVVALTPPPFTERNWDPGYLQTREPIVGGGE